jgi:ADP-ribose pyrophosphatase YjhB (NUDIX family)
MARRARRLLGVGPAYAHVLYEALAPRALGGAGRPRVVQAVVRGPRGVLLCARRELLGWELPGGAVRPGERDEEALAREVREETGVEVAPLRLVGVYERSGFRAHEAHVFAGRVAGGAPRASRETPEVAWFDEERLPAAIFPWFRGPLEDALAERPEPVRRREHQGIAAIAAGARIDLRSRWRGLD